MSRLAFLAGLAIGASLMYWLTRKSPRTGKPTEPEDRFDLAGLDSRMKQYDREYRLERKHGKQP